MPTPCSWCTHPRRGEIERRVADGWSYRQVVETFGGSIPSASRHFRLGHPADRPMTPEQLAQPHSIAIPAGALDSIRRPEADGPGPVTSVPDVSEAGSAAVGASPSGSSAGSLRGELADLVSGADRLAVNDLAGDELDEARELLSALAALLSSAPDESSNGVSSDEAGMVSDPVVPAEPGLPTRKERAVVPVAAPNEVPAALDLPITVHFLGPMVVSVSTSLTGDGLVLSYGDELAVTADVIAANTDRFGDSWLSSWLSGSADGYWRGEREMCRRGPWPESRCRLQPGDWAWEEARGRDTREALAVADPAERANRLNWVRNFYGASVESRNLSREPSRGAR